MNFAIVIIISVILSLFVAILVALFIFKRLSAIIIIFLILSSLSCSPQPPRQFIFAQFNYSQFQVKHDSHWFGDGQVNVVYYDANDYLIKSSGDTTFPCGYYFPYAEVEDTLLTHVIAINVLQTLKVGKSLTQILSHEYEHYRQYKQFGTVAMRDYLLYDNNKREMFELEAKSASFEYPALAIITGLQKIKSLNIKSYFLYPNKSRGEGLKKSLIRKRK